MTPFADFSWIYIQMDNFGFWCEALGFLWLLRASLSVPSRAVCTDTLLSPVPAPALIVPKIHDGNRCWDGPIRPSGATSTFRAAIVCQRETAVGDVKRIEDGDNAARLRAAWAALSKTCHDAGGTSVGSIACGNKKHGQHKWTEIDTIA